MRTNTSTARVMPNLKPSWCVTDSDVEVVDSGFKLVVESGSGRLLNRISIISIADRVMRDYLKACKTNAAPFAALAAPRSITRLAGKEHVEGFGPNERINVKSWTFLIMASLAPVVSWKRLPAASSDQSGRYSSVFIIIGELWTRDVRILLELSWLSYRTGQTPGRASGTSALHRESS